MVRGAPYIGRAQYMQAYITRRRCSGLEQCLHETFKKEAVRLGAKQRCMPAGLLWANCVQPLEEVDDLAQQHGGRQQARPEGVEQEEQESLVV